LGATLARVGVLLQKPEWTDEGVAAAKKWLTTPDEQNFSDNENGNVAESVAETLFESKRGPEAETILADALAAATRSGNTQSSYSWNGNSASGILAELAALYHKAGRQDDVLALLQEAPDWGVKDASELFTESPWDNKVSLMWLHTGSSALPVPYLA